MHCIYLDGKGLTILNALLQNTDYPIIYYPAAVTGKAVNIKNINVYNYCIIGLGYCVSLVGGDYTTQSSSDQMKYKFNNCHFAGISIGYPKLPRTANRYYNFLGTGNDNQYSLIGEYSYKDCTFNHHIKQQGDGAGVFCLIGYSPYDSKSRCYLYMDNCVLCLSGYNKGAIYSYASSLAIVQFNNTTMKNSINNKLKCASFSFTTHSGDYAGYNYFKMYVEAENHSSGAITINNTQTLINSSRLVVPTDATTSLTGIVMQEYDISNPDQFLLSSEPADWSTDWTKYFTKSGNVYTHVTGDTAPTFSINTYYNVPTDYIYLDENLEAKGFLTGQVIT